MSPDLYISNSRCKAESLRKSTGAAVLDQLTFCSYDVHHIDCSRDCLFSCLANDVCLEVFWAGFLTFFYCTSREKSIFCCPTLTLKRTLLYSIQITWDHCCALPSASTLITVAQRFQHGGSGIVQALRSCCSCLCNFYSELRPLVQALDAIQSTSASNLLCVDRVAPESGRDFRR